MYTELIVLQLGDKRNSFWGTLNYDIYIYKILILPDFNSILEYMNSGIYKIKNNITNDFYIGSSVNLKRRFSFHKLTLKRKQHDNQILQKVFNKYGSENLAFEIVEIVEDKTKLIEREQYYINTLNPRYNICKIAGNTLGYKHSKNAKLKMSNYWKGRLIGEKNPMYGHHHNEETRLKISSKLKDNKNGLGYKHTDEAKQKMSAIHKGKKLSEDQKMTISKANKNKIVSQETKNKMSISASKLYKIITPDNQVITLISVKKFCEKNNLGLSSMSALIQGKRNSYKGYTKYIEVK